jgi:hypothetical protein
MRSTFAAIGIVAIAACREAPVEAPRAADAMTPASAVGVSALPSCTHHWANGVSGDWVDAAMWSPAAVPTTQSTVCIDAPGTYTVTLDTTASIRGLRVGGAGAAATLRFDRSPAANPARAVLASSRDVEIEAGSKLGMHRCATTMSVDGHSLSIDGELSMNANCSGDPNFITAAAVVVRGSLEVRNTTLVVPDVGSGTGHFTAAGTITMFNRAVLAVRLATTGDARLQSGTIGGAGSLAIIGEAIPGDTSRISWTGAALQARSDDTTLAVVSVSDGIVTLPTVPTTGFLSIANNAGLPPTRVSGSVSPNMHLAFHGSPAGRFILGGAGGGAFVNRGRVDVVGLGGLGTDPVMEVQGGFLNRGTFHVKSGGMEIDADSLVNTGTMQVDTTTTFSGNNNLLRNRSRITVAAGAELVMKGGTFYRGSATSRMTGVLRLDDANLAGEGIVGDVIAVSSSVSPGEPIGTIRANSLTLDPPSGLTIEVGGTAPGTFDQLIVAGNVSYGNASLTIVTLAPFPGGTCGDFVPFMRDHSSAPRGAFGKTFGFSPGPTRSWRTYNPTDTLALVGFNPVVQVSASPLSLSVGEGGPPATYATCLRSAPTSNVTVNGTLATGQVNLTGAPVVFTPTDWSPPRRVTVRAIDDATIEPPETDRVTHDVVSSDPAFDGQPLGFVDLTVADDDGSADLALTVTQAPPPGLTVGQNFDTGFRVTNTGPTLSTGSTFTVPPIAGVTFVSAVGATCTRSLATGLSCSVPGMATGGSVVFTITARAVASGTHAIPMALTGHQGDPDLADNALVKNVVVN